MGSFSCETGCYGCCCVATSNSLTFEFFHCSVTVFPETFLIY